eukprot:1395586-Prymnesium_polylepis.1
MNARCIMLTAMGAVPEHTGRSAVLRSSLGGMQAGSLPPPPPAVWWHTTLSVRLKLVGRRLVDHVEVAGA